MAGLSGRAASMRHCGSGWAISSWAGGSCMPPAPEWIPTTNLVESTLPMENETRNEGAARQAICHESRLGDVAREASRELARTLARARQEGEQDGVADAGGGLGGRPLLRLDRWSSSPGRRRPLPAALHSPSAQEQM